VVFDSQHQVLDDDSIDKIYHGDPQADASIDTADNGAPANDDLVTQAST
jgi:hypothetical protein